MKILPVLAAAALLLLSTLGAISAASHPVLAEGTPPDDLAATSGAATAPGLPQAVVRPWVVFTPTGSMARPRAYHTATTLPNGQVLVVGTPLYSQEPVAELFDPATGLFAESSGWAYQRSLHTATLLPNGKVFLAAGTVGMGQGMIIGGTQLYDVASDRFTEGPNLQSYRESHTATLLPDGNVLLVGCCSKYDPWAELYDPIKNSTRWTGRLLTPRRRHTATLLPDGKVLIAGGQDMSDGLYLGTASTELYDPVAGTFTTTMSLSMPRFDHSAVRLLDGRVLILGGATAYPSPSAPSTTLDSAEIYDPVSGRFTPTGHLLTARSDAEALLMPDGRVVVIGGLADGLADGLAGPPLASVEVYDPGRGSFSRAGELVTARCRANAVLLADNRILVTGGRGPSTGAWQYLDSAEIGTYGIGWWEHATFLPVLLRGM